MFFILEQNVDMMGGGSSYTYITSRRTIQEAQEWISNTMRESENHSWTPHYIITQMVG